MAHNHRRTSAEKVELYEVTSPLLKAMYVEFKELSKKKPDGAINKPKIRIVNRLLEKCRAVVKDELFIEYLDLLDEDEVPQNSDVVLILSQYVAAMKTFYSTYYVRDGLAALDYQWLVEQDDDEELNQDEDDGGE